MEAQPKIAIHANQGSASDKWILYCEKNSIPYKIVNCYQNDIVAQMKDCDALLWHFHHNSIKDKLFAKQLLFSLEQAGKIVFPNFNTSWHFDDKMGQKYLLEASGLPCIATYLFFQKQQAMAWAKNASYPKVFKLRNGAGSSNVRLVKHYRHASSLINKAFGKGFLSEDRWYRLKEAMRKFKWTTSSFMKCLKGGIRVAIPAKYVREQKKEKGYIYFQDFIPNNDSDIRVIVIDRKVYGMKRYTRKNDFRASGSQNFSYEMINKKVLSIALSATEKLSLQSAAFDFVFLDGVPLIVEISYGFGTKGSGKCKGYWDEQLAWHEGPFNPMGWMVDTVLKEFAKKNSGMLI